MADHPVDDANPSQDTPINDQSDELSLSIQRLTQNRDDILAEKRELSTKYQTLLAECDELKILTESLNGQIVQGSKQTAIEKVMAGVHDNFTELARAKLEAIVSVEDGKTIFKEGDKVLAESVSDFLTYASTSPSWMAVLKAPETRGAGAYGNNGNYSASTQTSSSFGSKSSSSQFGIGK